MTHLHLLIGFHSTTNYHTHTHFYFIIQFCLYLCDIFDRHELKEIRSDIGKTIIIELKRPKGTKTQQRIIVAIIRSLRKVYENVGDAVFIEINIPEFAGQQRPIVLDENNHKIKYRHSWLQAQHVVL